MLIYILISDLGWCSQNRFKLVVETKEEQAVKLLTDAGYIITPPKPKVTGTVAIIKTATGRFRAEKSFLLTDGNRLDDDKIPSGETIVARLTWTEGDGL